MQSRNVRRSIASACRLCTTLPGRPSEAALQERFAPRHLSGSVKPRACFGIIPALNASACKRGEAFGLWTYLGPLARSNLIDWLHDKRIESLVCPRRELSPATPDLRACHGGVTHTANAVARATPHSSADLMRSSLAVPTRMLPSLHACTDLR